MDNHGDTDSRRIGRILCTKYGLTTDRLQIHGKYFRSTCIFHQNNEIIKRFVLISFKKKHFSRKCIAFSLEK